MKNTRSLAMVCTIVMLFFVTYLFAQVESPLKGKFNVISNDFIDKIEFKNEKVVAYKSKKAVQYYILVSEPTPNEFLLVKVDSAQETYSPQEKKDRLLIKVLVEVVEDSNYRLTITYPNGKTETLLLQK